MPFNPINSSSAGAAFANKAFGKVSEYGVLTPSDKESLVDEFAQLGSAKTQKEAMDDLKLLEKSNPLGGFGSETLHDLEADMAKLQKPDTLWGRASGAVSDAFESVGSRAGALRQNGVDAVANGIKTFNQEAADLKAKRIDRAVNGGDN